MGASRFLVRFMVRISAFWFASFDEEMAIWLDGGSLDLALLISTPPSGGGEGPRFDIVDV
jgi:hypothetical protein